MAAFSGIHIAEHVFFMQMGKRLAGNFESCDHQDLGEVTTVTGQARKASKHRNPTYAFAEQGNHIVKKCVTVQAY